MRNALDAQTRQVDLDQAREETTQRRKETLGTPRVASGSSSTGVAVLVFFPVVLFGVGQLLESCMLSACRGHVETCGYISQSADGAGTLYRRSIAATSSVVAGGAS